MTTTTTLRKGDALIIIDVQNDFLPGGALAVPQGDEIVPLVNEYMRLFSRRRLPVFVTREWHPSNHCEFTLQWWRLPKHCVMETTGAAFPPGLELPQSATVVSKGTIPTHEVYSAFTDTTLEASLRQTGVRRLFIGGLGMEFCVLHTARDATKLGFDVVLLRDAVRSAGVTPACLSDMERELRELKVCSLTFDQVEKGDSTTSALLTDLYQITMLRAYHASGMTGTARFEFFVRHLPPQWNFLIAAGLEQVLEFLEDFHFSPAELEWLGSVGGFDSGFLKQLSTVRFTGDVHAMPEGTIFFPDEPILRVTAPIAEAQVIETRLVNLLHFQTLIASKSVRSVIAAPGKNLVEFGARRAYGGEASLLAARASYIAGFGATSNVLAGERFGIPTSGTIAHSFVEACDNEEEAFLRFARANPDNVVLVLDTYDTEAAARRVVALASTLRSEGIPVKGVRLDSGDLASHAQRVRRILDEGGLRETTIFASGNLDEVELQRLARENAPIDGFGLGSRVTTSADAPYLDCAYKLQAYAGTPRCKHSEGKATWPGAKQVYRHFDHEGTLSSDVIALDSETCLGRPLLECVMRHGHRTRPVPTLPEIAERVKEQIAHLPVALRALDRAADFRVVKSHALQDLARQMGVFPAEAGAGIPPDPVKHHGGFAGRIYADSAPETGEDSEVEDHVRL